jgi:DNA-binding response OmpR family regulator
LTIGPLYLDLVTQKSTLRGRDFPLSGKELLLLYSLAQHLGTPVSRQKLLQLVWSGEAPEGSKTLDVHIYRLRRKLDEAAQMGHLLITVRKRGYMLSAALAEA